MNSFVDAINRNSPAISLLFSLVVTGATVFYAVLTHRLLSETRRMREVQTEPALAIWIEPSEHGLNFINLVIENAGQGAARSVTLSSTPDFQRSRGKVLSSIGLFKHGIKHLAARQRITFFLTSILDEVHGSGDDLSHLDFTIDATYQSGIGRTYKESFAIRFESFEGFGTIGTPPLISIADDLGKLEGHVSHLASGFRKLEVVAHTRSEIERDNEEMRRRYEAAVNKSKGLPVEDLSAVTPNEALQPTRADAKKAGG